MKRRAYIALSLVTLGVYLVMVLWSLPRIAEAAGGAQPFDMRPLGYTPDAAWAFLEALPQDMKRFYSHVQHRLDMAFPVLLALWIAVSATWLFPRPLVHAVSLVALIGMAADLSENAAVARLLDSYDAETARAAARWTVIKSACATLALTALLAGFILRLFGRRAGA